VLKKGTDDYIGNILYIVIAEGLTPSGVDLFKMYQSVRMVNKSYAKTQVWYIPILILILNISDDNVTLHLLDFQK
jgi:hypothetical protein